jgi:hypothetical protein
MFPTHPVIIDQVDNEDAEEKQRPGTESAKVTCMGMG